MDDAALAIQNLIYRYARLLDAGQLEQVAALFKHANIIDQRSGTELKGSDEVLAMYHASIKRYDCQTPRTKHIISNVEIYFDTDTDTAESFSSFTVMQQTDSLALQAIIVGAYHDRFEWIDNQWQFRQRHIDSQLLGDLSAHLNFNLN